MSEEILESFAKLMMKDKSDLAFMVMEKVADNCDLQQRIDKAIELIHNILKNPEAYRGKDNVNNLLSILQGEEVKDNEV